MKLHFAFIAAGLLGCGPSSAAVSVVDGDFSTTSPDWQGTGTWARYQVASNEMFALQADNLAPFYSAAGGQPSSQATVIIPVQDLILGGIYEISFDFASVEGYYLTGEFDPILTLGLGGVELLVDGTPAGPMLQGTGVRLVDPGAPFPHTYNGLVGPLVRGAFTFTAPAEFATLGFLAVENPGTPAQPPDVPNALVLLDNVALKLIAIPEPSSALLTIVGIAACLGLRKR